jgi:hypothetical protein
VTLLADYQRFLTDEQASAAYKAWAKQNPGELKTWLAFDAAVVSGGTPALPTLKTAFGRGLVDVAEMLIESYPTPAPPVAPPPALGTLPAQGISVSTEFLSLSAAVQSSTLDLIAQLFNGKPGWVRIDWWPSTPASDQAIAAVKARGFVPMGLTNAPYSSGMSQTDFAARAVQLAGICDFVNVFNEPDMDNGPSSWPATTAGQYARAAYDAIVAAHPHVTVIGPSLWKTESQKPADGLTYAGAMIAAGGRFVHIWDQHLYGDPATVDPSWNPWDWAFRNNGNNVRTLLNNHGMTDVPIMCTEAGDSVAVNGLVMQNNAVAHGMDARASLGLRSFGVYSMRNSAPPGGFGLVDDQFAKRPAFSSMQARAI